MDWTGIGWCVVFLSPIVATFVLCWYALWRVVDNDTRWAHERPLPVPVRHVHRPDHPAEHRV